MTPYQEYQLHWMLEHGYSLQDVIQALTQLQYDDPEDSDRISTPVSQLYDEWEQDIGFGSEIWACEAEWRETESAAEELPEPDEDPLMKAVTRQNRYMAACGGAFGVQEADETFNDTNRDIIRAFIEKHGTAVLGKYNFSGDERAAVIDGSKCPLWEYAGEKLYTGCADFILPCKDEHLIEMLRRWNRDGDSRVVPHITNLVETLGGILLLWV